MGSIHQSLHRPVSLPTLRIMPLDSQWIAMNGYVRKRLTTARIGVAIRSGYGSVCGSH